MARRLSDVSQAGKASQRPAPKSQTVSRIQQAFLQVWKPNKSNGRHLRETAISPIINWLVTLVVRTDSSTIRCTELRGCWHLMGCVVYIVRYLHGNSKPHKVSTTSQFGTRHGRAACYFFSPLFSFSFWECLWAITVEAHAACCRMANIIILIISPQGLFLRSQCAGAGSRPPM